MCSCISKCICVRVCLYNNIMYFDLVTQKRLQPDVLFDWRLVAERGLQCYDHIHKLNNYGAKKIASCEISFLTKASKK